MILSCVSIFMYIWVASHWRFLWMSKILSRLLVTHLEVQLLAQGRPPSARLHTGQSTYEIVLGWFKHEWHEKITAGGFSFWVCEEKRLQKVATGSGRARRGGACGSGFLEWMSFQIWDWLQWGNSQCYRLHRGRKERNCLCTTHHTKKLWVLSTHTTSSTLRLLGIPTILLKSDVPGVGIWLQRFKSLVSKMDLTWEASWRTGCPYFYPTGYNVKFPQAPPPFMLDDLLEWLRGLKETLHLL